MGFRKLQEKLENNNSEICHTTPSTNEPSLFPNKQNFHFVPIKKGGGVQVLMTFKDCTMHKVIHPNVYKYLKKAAQHSHLGWFLAE